MSSTNNQFSLARAAFRRGSCATRIACVAQLLRLTLSAAVPAQDYEWTSNNGTITITKYTGSDRRVTIPDTINGLPVTSIGSNAFLSCFSATSITIPNGVTNIGNRAFFYCLNLTGVAIPASVTNIGEWAFSHCTSLATVTIPDGVPSIGSHTFDSCASLTSVTIPNSVTNIGEWAFSYCTSLTAAMIGNRVTDIGSFAFCSCTNLTSVTIPNSVTNIGEWAFYSCDSLTSATIGNHVTSIGDYAFRSCASLTTVTIPNSVTSIGNYAFFYCLNLTSVTIPSSVTRIGDYAFCGCIGLSAITVAADNTAYSSVDGVLFNKSQTTLIQCPGAKAGSFKVPDSVAWIGSQAFDSCAGLTGLYFKGNAPGLGSYVFDGADNATVYYLPGTAGWALTFGGRPTALWLLPEPLILNKGPGFGVRSNGFGFTISWATNIPVVVEACTNLANHTWSPASTNPLTNGWSYFSDPDWINYPARFYRIRSP